MNDSPPFKHSRVISGSPVYYGWVILLAGTVGMIMTTPGQTTGVSVFLDKIIDDLALSRSAVSLMYTLGTLLGSFALPFVGRFIDRRGPRVAVAIIAALFALACVWMGFVSGLVTLLIGFTLIRGLGQGALGLVSVHVINLWFVRRRGLAVGLAGVGMAAATALFPMLIEALIARLEWRQAYMALGALVALSVLPLGIWLFREHPERFGLYPDSQAAPADGTSSSEAAYSFARARRTLTFWLFVSGGVLVSALSTGLVFHHYSIMATSGIDRAAASTMFVSFGFIMAGANLLTGILVDRVSPRYPLSVMLVLLAAALLVAPHVASVPMVLAYGATLGVMQGMSGAIQASVYAYYFGRAELGAIKGFASTLTVLGSALGPLLFAAGFDAFGSYTLVLAVSAVPVLLIGALAPWLKLKQGERLL